MDSVILRVWVQMPRLFITFTTTISNSILFLAVQRIELSMPNTTQLKVPCSALIMCCLLGWHAHNSDQYVTFRDSFFAVSFPSQSVAQERQYIDFLLHPSIFIFTFFIKHTCHHKVELGTVLWKHKLFIPQFKLSLCDDKPISMCWLTYYLEHVWIACFYLFCLCIIVLSFIHIYNYLPLQANLYFTSVFCFRSLCNSWITVYLHLDLIPLVNTDYRWIHS